MEGRNQDHICRWDIQIQLATHKTPAALHTSAAMGHASSAGCLLNGVSYSVTANSQYSRSRRDSATSWQLLICMHVSHDCCHVFAGMGDKEPGRPADDLVFVIAEKPHSSFTREGNDLHTTVSLPLKIALAGGSVEVRPCWDSLFRYSGMHIL